MLGALADLGSGLAHWRTSYLLALQDITLRYRRSVLGPFWISASLVVSVMALAYVFSSVFQQPLEGYIGWVAGGMLAWQLVSGVMNEACQSVIMHTAYLQNVPLPLSVIGARTAIRDGIIFLHNAIAIIGVLVVFGLPMTPTAFLIIPGALLIMLVGFFAALLLGPICVRFRDVPQAVTSALQVIFYLTPIFWQPHEGSHRPIFTTANPFYHLVQLIRAPLLGEQPTLLDWQFSWWTCAVFAVLAMFCVSATRKHVTLWL
ncbi:MAG: ABC transporter permease [Terricaulis sp.]